MHPPVKKLIDIPRMADIAQAMLRDALDAFVRRDIALAQQVLNEDDKLDALKTQVFRELLTYMLQDPTTIEPSLDLILISRHLERIGDHATNIAEDVIFMVSARDVRHHAPECRSYDAPNRAIVNPSPTAPLPPSFRLSSLDRRSSDLLEPPVARAVGVDVSADPLLCRVSPAAGRRPLAAVLQRTVQAARTWHDGWTATIESRVTQSSGRTARDAGAITPRLLTPRPYSRPGRMPDTLTITDNRTGKQLRDPHPGRHHSGRQICGRSRSCRTTSG